MDAAWARARGIAGRHQNRGTQTCEDAAVSRETAPFVGGMGQEHRRTSDIRPATTAAARESPPRHLQVARRGSGTSPYLERSTNDRLRANRPLVIYRSRGAGPEHRRIS